ncbi:spore coat protein [Radiobacillus kanasensis]|uniref:CotD family spore coat protein n=1 Tax=Radiobacillus kanasensis TaxID=2844358 RepID=UPI001E46F0B7|nr:CotD family spore coat protein [Radiobacillus kanasensis]UFU01266.1 spore coat protein [Radiobacillus kanasensis]
MRHHKPYGAGCGFPRPIDKVVYPTKHNMIDHCFENTVEHIHPSHTTIVNHHLQKNAHVYPHSTSVDNTFDSVDYFAGAYQVPSPMAPVPPVAGPGAVPPVNPGLGANTPPYGPYPGNPGLEGEDLASPNIASPYDPGKEYKTMKPYPNKAFKWKK